MTDDAADGGAYLGEIRLLSFSFAPKYWAFCNGQLLSITENLALFSLLGTTYGGDGRTTFQLPDLRGRIPMHAGGGHLLGEIAGTESVTLTLEQLPKHNHLANVEDVNATVGPAGNFLAASNALYEPPPTNMTLAPNTITNAGEYGPHENRQPYAALSFAICLAGIFPSKN